MKEDSYREEFLKLKWEAFDKRDYKTVKLLRLKIKEYDRKHPPKEKVKPYELFDGLKKLREEAEHEHLRREQYTIRG